MNSRTIFALMFLLPCACTHDPRLIRPDYSKSHLAVVTGYFSHAKGVHAVTQTCFPGEVIDCGLPPVAVADFKVEGVLYGVSPRASLTIRVNLYRVDDPFPIGMKNRVLLFLTSDGQVHDFEGAYRLARNVNGQWLLPVVEKDNLPRIPCIADPEAQAVAYLEPRPSVRLSDLPAKDRKHAVDEGLLEVNGDFGFYKYGVFLRDLHDAYAAPNLGNTCQW